MCVPGLAFAFATHGMSEAKDGYEERRDEMQERSAAT